MKRVAVSLAILVRMTKQVVVEVPDSFDEKNEMQASTLLEAVYEDDDGDGYGIDDTWGCEEGTHDIIGLTDLEPSLIFDGSMVYDPVGVDDES